MEIGCIEAETLKTKCGELFEGSSEYMFYGLGI